MPFSYHGSRQESHVTLSFGKPQRVSFIRTQFIMHVKFISVRNKKLVFYHFNLQMNLTCEEKVTSWSNNSLNLSLEVGFSKLQVGKQQKKDNIEDRNP